MKILSLLIAGISVLPLHGQNPPADPYRAGTAAPAAAEAPETQNISICYEAFSLPLATAAKLQREQLPDSELYKQLVAAVEKEAARQETFVVLRSKSGQRATADSVSEEIYPAEANPPQLPNSVGVAISPPAEKDTPPPAPDASKLRNAADLSAFKGVQTPATPSAFQTRNCGVGLEIEPTLSDDLRTVDLRLAPDRTIHTGRESWGQGLSQIEQPVFESQRINTNFSARINQPFLAGTTNRPPVSKADPDSANRVWFAFVTVTLAKP